MNAFRTTGILLAGALCAMAVVPAHAAMVDFSFSGTVEYAEKLYPDWPYPTEVVTGDTVRVYGQFDDSGISGVGTEYIGFGLGTGNHITIEVGDYDSFTENDDIEWRYDPESPRIALLDGGLAGLWFYYPEYTGSDKFISRGYDFYANDSIYYYDGRWDLASFSVVVPLPPAAGLFACGLLGLGGRLRRGARSAPSLETRHAQ